MQLSGPLLPKQKIRNLAVAAIGRASFTGNLFGVQRNMDYTLDATRWSIAQRTMREGLFFQR